MAANKKSSNTSKTAHVMNLLSKNKGGGPPAAPAAPDEGGEGRGPSAAASPIPPVLDALDPDASVSEQIRGALEDALEEELRLSPPSSRDPLPGGEEALEPGPPPAALERDPAPQGPARSAEPEPPAQGEDSPLPQAEDGPAPAPAPPEVPASGETEGVPPPLSAPPGAPAPHPQAGGRPAAEPTEPPVELEPPEVPSAPPSGEDLSPSAQGEPYHDLNYINVMQVLVEEKADKYIKLFGLCPCRRCKIDVMALALNNLPPKYVAMPAGEVIPRISVYEGRYNTAVTAQIMWACKVVMERPRHGPQT